MTTSHTFLHRDRGAFGATLGFVVVVALVTTQISACEGGTSFTHELADSWPVLAGLGGLILVGPLLNTLFPQRIVLDAAGVERRRLGILKQRSSWSDIATVSIYVDRTLGQDNREYRNATRLDFEDRRHNPLLALSSGFGGWTDQELREIARTVREMITELGLNVRFDDFPEPELSVDIDDARWEYARQNGTRAPGE